MSDALCIIEHDPERPAQRWIGLLCQRHRRRMDDDVAEIGLLIVDTQRIVDGGAPTEPGARGQHQKKRADPPPPGDVRLMAMFDKRTKVTPVRATTLSEPDWSEPETPVLAVVASWVLLVAEERPLSTVLPRSVLGQLDLLRRHGDWMAGQAWVDDFLLEMAGLRKALASAVADHPVTRVGVCHLSVGEDVCGGPLLRENGSSVVRCSKCRAQWTTAQEIARLAVAQ